jgi:L-malate glycosyltransferase
MSRIGIINTNGMPWGGCDPIWVEAVEIALSKGHEVFVFCNKFSEKPEKILNLEKKGATFFFLKNTYLKTILNINKVLNFLSKSSLFLTYYQPLINFKPDVIFINLAGGDEFVGNKELFKAIIGSQVPVYLMVHSYQESYIPSLDEIKISKYGFSKAKNVFFTSRHQLEGTAQKIMYSGNNLRVIGNPITFTPEIINYPTGEVINFALPGYLRSRWKGQDIAIRLFAQSQWKNRKWQLNIYGSGPDEAYLKSLVEYYNLNEHIFFHGYLNDITEVWSCNNIALLPSRQDSGPLTAIETMACGRAIIGTNIGLMADMIDENCGFLSDSQNIKAFEVVLENAWQKKEHWKQMGINAYQQFLTKYQPLQNKKLIDYLLKTQE